MSEKIRKQMALEITGDPTGALAAIARVRADAEAMFRQSQARMRERISAMAAESRRSMVPANLNQGVGLLRGAGVAAGATYATRMADDMLANLEKIQAETGSIAENWDKAAVAVGKGLPIVGSLASATERFARLLAGVPPLEAKARADGEARLKVVQAMADAAARESASRLEMAKTLREMSRMRILAGFEGPGLERANLNFGESDQVRDVNAAAAKRRQEQLDASAKTQAELRDRKDIGEGTKQQLFAINAQTDKNALDRIEADRLKTEGAIREAYAERRKQLDKKIAEDREKQLEEYGKKTAETQRQIEREAFDARVAGLRSEGKEYTAAIEEARQALADRLKQIDADEKAARAEFEKTFPGTRLGGNITDVSRRRAVAAAEFARAQSEARKGWDAIPGGLGPIAGLLSGSMAMIDQALKPQEQVRPTSISGYAGASASSFGGTGAGFMAAEAARANREDQNAAMMRKQLKATEEQTKILEKVGRWLTSIGVATA